MLRESLGILGMETAPFLADRIYSLIDVNQTGQVIWSVCSAY